MDRTDQCRGVEGPTVFAVQDIENMSSHDDWDISKFLTLFKTEEEAEDHVLKQLREWSADGIDAEERKDYETALAQRDWVLAHDILIGQHAWRLFDLTEVVLPPGDGPLFVVQYICHMHGDDPADLMLFRSEAEAEEQRRVWETDLTEEDWDYARVNQIGLRCAAL